MTDKQIMYNCPHISLTDWGTYACKLYNPRDKNCIVSGGNCASNTNCPYKQNFEKDIDVPSKKKIMYDYNAKDCEQCNPDSICCYCKNIACYKLEEQLKAKEQECEVLKKANIYIENNRKQKANKLMRIEKLITACSTGYTDDFIQSILAILLEAELTEV